ncbi:probable arginine--tRNA ligase, mitochondrial [Aplysia californica]|uniref:Probable arginine--tRNA ligase, mitochondrial n=1 Tax=Aplysia californica TaxID=6500 RepID=A0ABM0JY06_APLCA|nr:probable arginine--tRNA ligase, mitochondrial [Aplysia californica]
MAVHYKNIIANELIRKALGEVVASKKLKSGLHSEVFKLIKTLPVKRQSEGSPQFGIKTTDLSHHFQENVKIPETVGEGIVSNEVEDSVYFRIDPVSFAQTVLKSVRADGSNYGHRDTHQPPQCVCVEFSSPNIAKPFHVGHMRSTIIGNVMSNLYEAAGHDVKRANFLGDWGTQFGLLMLGLQRYSQRKRVKADPLQEFFEVYVKINKDVKEESGERPESSSQTYQEGMSLFSKLEKGDPDLRSVWQEVRELSIAELDKMYQRLGVHFSHIMPESCFQDKTSEVLQCLRDASLLQFDSNGVGYVNVNIQENMGKANVVKSDGSSLYLTRDIAAALERETMFACDRMHYVVEMGQRSHFVKLVSVLNQLGVPWAQRPIDEIHIRFGRVKGMSTRSGNVVFLRDILDEARERVAHSMRDRPTTRVSGTLDAVADTLAVSAIILQDLKSHRANDYSFSWERMLSFKADSGIFAQYCHSRLCSMMNSCGVEAADADVDLDSIAEDVALHRIVLHLARFPEVFETSLSSLEPHHIVQYLYRLCHLINAAYSTCPVKGQPTDVAQARLSVFAGAKQVLANCLQLLGLPLVDKM